MLSRSLAAVVALLVTTASAEARRVALVIGQNAYAALDKLSNPSLDARRMAELLSRHGFEVIACDGTTPGCFDQTREGLQTSLELLAAKAKGADMALVFFAGHGLETGAGNVLAPIDATVDCATMSVGRGVLVEQVLAATAGARHKIVILDACRDQPLGKVCPPLAAGKVPSFK